MSNENQDARKNPKGTDTAAEIPPETLAPNSHFLDPTRRRTAAGTPCARSWSDYWVGEVESAEARAGRRICGARTMAGVPCRLKSSHPSGRCRFHGGFDLTGAPKGNRNAVLHGLYSRRLQVCGRHCARWETCPLAGRDVVDAARVRRLEGDEAERREGGDGRSTRSDQSDPTDRSDGSPVKRCPANKPHAGSKNPAHLPALSNNEQPTTSNASSPSSLSPYPSPSSSSGLPPTLYTCPFEQAEYNAVLTDGLARVEASGDSFDLHTVHTLALLQVMVSRAAGALTQTTLHETTVVEAGDYRQESTKLHTYLQAFLRLQREHDRVRKSLDALRRDGARVVSAEAPLGPEGEERADSQIGESLMPQEPLVETVKRHQQRAAHDTDLDPDAQAAIHFEDAIARQQAERELARAVLYGARGRDVPMVDAVERAWLLDPELVERREDAVLAAYRPGKEVLPAKAVKRVVRAMTRSAGGSRCG